MHTFFMDTKRIQTIEHKNRITEQAIAFIKTHKPDLIIAADDNASAYIIEPYFKNHAIPVVFLGVNNDASTYGYPYKNATGIIEMDGILNLIQAIRTIDKIKSVGMIFSETNSSNKIFNYIKNENPENVTYHKVKNAQEWYKTMSMLNESVDYITLNTISGIKGLSNENALNYIRNNIKIPILSASTTSQELAHIGYINTAEEQGIWAAKTADGILNGHPFSQYPITKSNLYLMFFNEDLISETKPRLAKRLYNLPHTTLKRLAERQAQ